MASAIAWRLYMANMRDIFMLETAYPLAVRCQATFCEAIPNGCYDVEGVCAVSASHVCGG